MCKAVRTAGGEPDEDKVARAGKRKRSSPKSRRRKSDTKRGHRDAHASRVDDRSIHNSDIAAQDPSESFS